MHQTLRSPIDNIAFDNTGDIACVAGKQRHYCYRTFGKRKALLDARNYRFWLTGIYYLQADKAQDNSGYVRELREFKKTRYGQVPSLRQQMARAGIDTAGLASHRQLKRRVFIIKAFRFVFVRPSRVRRTARGSFA